MPMGTFLARMLGSFSKNILGCVMTTESQDHGLMSYLKDSGELLFSLFCVMKVTEKTRINFMYLKIATFM